MITGLPQLSGRCGFAWAAPWSRGEHEVVDHECNEWPTEGHEHICPCGDTTNHS